MEGDGGFGMTFCVLVCVWCFEFGRFLVQPMRVSRDINDIIMDYQSPEIISIISFLRPIIRIVIDYILPRQEDCCRLVSAENKANRRSWR